MNSIFRSLSLSVLVFAGLISKVNAQFTFTTNNGSLTITGYTGTASSLVIPAETNGYPVTAIAPLVFVDASFASVTIPNGITTIGVQAFYACLNVPQIAIPASLTNIDSTAFNFCYNLTNFTVDPANTAYSSAGGVMFDKGQDLLFQYPENLPATTYTVPNTVTSIGSNSFDSCRNLNEVIIPSSVTNIGLGAFLGSIYLDQIIIPGSVITVGDAAFVGCEFATNLVIGSGVENIGLEAFDECFSVVNALTIPDSVRTIAAGAFDGCSSLPEVSIGSGVTNMGTNEFQNCSDLLAINVSAANTAFSSADGVLFDKAQTTLIEFPEGLTAANYVVSNTVTDIKDYAFDGCTKLFGVTFDAALTNIGSYAFNGCYELPSVAVPDNVRTIGGEAFESCDSIRALTFGTALGSVGAGAFYGCLGLTSVEIPATLTNLGLQAFGDCGSLTNISVDPENPVYASVGGVLFDKSMAELLEFPAAIRGGYAIPTSVNNIGADAFANSKLSAVTIPNSVTNIGNLAFFSDPFTNLDLPDSIVNIGAEAFEGLAVTNLVIPNSVVNIGIDAFEYCANLTNIIIDKYLQGLGSDAFYGCFALISANFLGNAPTNDSAAFFEDTLTTVYYQPGTSGWGPTFGSVPAVENSSAPASIQLQASGIISNQFTIELTGPANSMIVIQATPNLSNPNWIPISTNTLTTNGFATFHDPARTNFPSRFYRAVAE